MSKVELDDQILDHPKFVRAVKLAGSDAIFLWLGLRSYCSKLLTDGFIPADMADEVRGPRDQKRRAAALDALRTVNLVENVDGGVRLHDYLDHASSRAQIMAWRKANADRKAKSRGVSQRDSCRDGKCDDAVTPPVTDGVTTSGVPAPSPSLITDTDLPLPKERGDRFVNCPPDLDLTQEQKDVLSTSLVPAWAIPLMRAELVGKWVTRPADKTSDQWRSYLYAAMLNLWKSDKRPRKPLPTATEVQQQPPKPGQVWHKDGYWYFSNDSQGVSA